MTTCVPSGAERMEGSTVVVLATLVGASVPAELVVLAFKGATGDFAGRLAVVTEERLEGPGLALEGLLGSYIDLP